MSNKAVFYSFIIFVIVCIVIFIIKSGSSYRPPDYPFIDEMIEKEIYGIVVSNKPSMQQWQLGTYYVKMNNDSMNFSLRGATYNFLYPDKEYDIIDLIQTGDSISKKADNDTIYVYKGNRKYYFVAGKTINMANNN